MKILKLIFLLILVFATQSGCDQKNFANHPVAKKAVLDLRDWNFETMGNVPLNGEWRIDWENWSPKEDLTTVDYTMVPGHWTNSNSEKYPTGYATLSLTILLPENAKNLYLQNGVTRNAFEILIENNSIFQSGTIGKSISTEIPKLKVQTVALPDSKDQRIHLSLKISCFHYHNCGVATPYTIGNHSGINKLYLETISRDVFVFASLITLAFFHFVLYLFWRDEKTHIYFATVCFLAAVRLLSIGETRILYNYLPEGIYETIVRINGISFVLLYLAFVLYVKEIYHAPEYNLVYRTNYGIALLLFLALPLDIISFSKFLGAHLVLSLFGLLGLLYPIIHGVILRKPGSKFFLFSVVATISLFSLDILTEFAKRGIPYLAQYGFLVFGLSQALFIAERMIENFRNKERLKQEKENAEAKVKFKTSFLSTMSHEIRTPMNGILGMTQMLQQTELTEEQKEYLNLIKFSGDNLLLLVNDILDLTKLESGQFELHLEPISVRRLLHDCINIFKTQSDKNKLKVELEFVNEPPAFLITDQRRFAQILTNLLSNAVKFTEEGSIFVIVESTPIDDKKMRIKVSVKDTGIGIPEERMGNLFQPFSQVHSHLTEKTVGTGLGLAITKKIIEEMGGSISVQSIYGRGSNFTFQFDAEASFESIEGDVISTSNEMVKKTNWDSKLAEKYPLKILIADDDPINQKVSSLFLKKLGYTALQSENGEKTLDMIRTHLPDLVFLDIQMPDMDGITVTKIVRKSTSIEKQPVIVALTANVLEEEKQRCLSGGMDDFMTKPLLLHDLDFMIRKWAKKDLLPSNV
ncbi:ATP-binding protein [Leptospira bandrabouensis]|uniref:ATP-binding protein n=1 Tax=Leptospira bandrabouensis TaxID=2484903 RepID=UPI001EE92503|nr:ATP-binding protein [Leptospira bandrabouensis]MCG6142965.1 response regulator [Leptospira bandrabouensis]MCG6158624.1 response regulator [Leptospira bandrabouensis]MCG6162560.1 response regulator [Leptospira bandrabouensis]